MANAGTYSLTRFWQFADRIPRDSRTRQQLFTECLVLTELRLPTILTNPFSKSMNGLKQTVVIGDIAAVKRFISSGTSPESILSLAAQVGQLSVVEFILLQVGVDMRANNYEAVRLAAANGHFQIIRTLFGIMVECVFVGEGGTLFLRTAYKRALAEARLYHHHDIEQFLVQSLGSEK